MTNEEITTKEYENIDDDIIKNYEDARLKLIQHVDPEDKYSLYDHINTSPVSMYWKILPDCYYIVMSENKETIDTEITEDDIYTDDFDTLHYEHHAFRGFKDILIGEKYSAMLCFEYDRHDEELTLTFFDNSKEVK